MYTTQMDAARQGIITPQMKIVAEKERMDAEEIRSLVAKGQVIIPCNKNHKALHPSGVGARRQQKSTSTSAFRATGRTWIWSMKRYAPQWKWAQRRLWI